MHRRHAPPAVRLQEHADVQAFLIKWPVSEHACRSTSADRVKCTEHFFEICNSTRRRRIPVEQQKKSTPGFSLLSCNDDSGGMSPFQMNSSAICALFPRTDSHPHADNFLEFLLCNVRAPETTTAMAAIYATLCPFHWHGRATCRPHMLL